MKGVDAVAVGLQRGLGRGGQPLPLALRRLHDAQRAHEPVGVEGGLAKYLGELAAHDTALARVASDHLPLSGRRRMRASKD